MRDFGTGYSRRQGNVTKFAFPGDPVTGQRVERDEQRVRRPGQRAAATAASRSHTGPFTLDNGDAQDIVFGIVYGRGTSNLTSITALRAADQLAQTAYDIDFALAPPPPPPPLCVDGNPSVAPGSGTCLEAVDAGRPGTPDLRLPDDELELPGPVRGQFDALHRRPGRAGLDVQLRGLQHLQVPVLVLRRRRRVSWSRHIDVINGVTEVRDLQFRPGTRRPREFITARGTDSGIQYSFTTCRT